ncbi:MAG: hypothetical protein ACREPM_24905, partial [Gemmatimonadaceae bacterium]
MAFDARHQIAIVPVNRIAAFVQLIRLDQLDTNDMHHNESRLDDQYTRMHGTPYVMRRRILRSGTGLDLPCSKPPWGSLVAINLQTGAKAWDVPLGDPAGMRPEFGALAKTPLGTPNLGGPIVTAGSVAFIGASMDHVLRAFDVETGRELWK